jgi:hypothetical protein
MMQPPLDHHDIIDDEFPRVTLILDDDRDHECKSTNRSVKHSHHVLRLKHEDISSRKGRHWIFCDGAVTLKFGLVAVDEQTLMLMANMNHVLID